MPKLGDRENISLVWKMITVCISTVVSRKIAFRKHALCEFVWVCARALTQSFGRADQSVGMQRHK